MALTKEKKGEILQKLQKVVKDSASLVFVNFHGLPVKDAREVRKALREKGVGYIVAKKTLVRKSLDSAITGDMPDMPGELALVYGIDMLDPAHEIYEFQKKMDKRVQIVGGVFEGAFMDQNSMISIAQIPGLKTLQAQFVNLINSPIQGLVIALNGIAGQKA